MTDEILAGQVDYYRRRAGEYDATAYGDVAAARARIARLVAELRPAGRVLFIDEHVDERGKEAYVPGRDEVVERRLADGSTFRVIKNFVDPRELELRLRQLGWDCVIRRDGSDWVYGEARPVR